MNCLSPAITTLAKISSSILQKMEIPSERNIEIKARINSASDFERKIKIAKDLTQQTGEIIKQHDVFFNAKSGRLKLRYLENTKSQLIHYDRPDIAGPKLSKYNKVEVDEPDVMQKILADSVGIKGVVKKVRQLFLHKQTRIHLDQVENLGNFLEFEVCLKPEQTLNEGQQIAEGMMKIFEIADKDLMTFAYLDELMK